MYHHKYSNHSVMVTVLSIDRGVSDFCGIPQNKVELGGNEQEVRKNYRCGRVFFSCNAQVIAIHGDGEGVAKIGWHHLCQPLGDF